MVETHLTSAAVGAIAGQVVNELSELLTEDGQQKIDKQLLYLQNIMAGVNELVQDAKATRECFDLEEVVSLQRGYDWTAHRSGRKHLSILTPVELPILINSPIGTWPLTLEPGWNQVDPPEASGIRIAPSGPEYQNVMVFIGQDERAVNSEEIEGALTIPAPHRWEIIEEVTGQVIPPAYIGDIEDAGNYQAIIAIVRVTSTDGTVRVGIAAHDPGNGVLVTEYSAGSATSAYRSAIRESNADAVLLVRPQLRIELVTGTTATVNGWLIGVY